MIILLVIIHLAAALLLFLGWLNGVIHISPALLPANFLLPLWGPLCVVVYELHFRGGEKADQEAESIRFGITDEVYRNVRMDKGGVEDVLPIEDVLVSGSPRQRRSLLLSVLHSGPRDFVRSLRIAGVNDDTEVVHYAVTALVEIRSEYTQRIAEMEKKLSACPGDPRILLAYADLDEEYLKSGIPEESEKTELIADCRNKLEKCLGAVSWELRAAGNSGAVSNSGDRTAIMKRLAEICLLQGDNDSAEYYTGILQEENPYDGECCLLRVRAKALARDGGAIKEILSEADGRNVYFSPEQRKQIEFWSAVS